MPATGSFETEALPHLDAVYRFALRLSGSAADAEDLVQETFLRAFRAWSQFEPGTNAKSWLFTICRNAFLRQRERELRRTEVTSQAAQESAADVPPGGETVALASTFEGDPEASFFRALVDDTVIDAIDHLPAEFREAVVLSDLEGLPYADIAVVLGIPVGTVKSRLFRGRRLLQRELYDFARESGYVHSRANHD